MGWEAGIESCLSAKDLFGKDDHSMVPPCAVPQLRAPKQAQTNPHRSLIPGSENILPVPVHRPLECGGNRIPLTSGDPGEQL